MLYFLTPYVCRDTEAIVAAAAGLHTATEFWFADFFPPQHGFHSSVSNCSTCRMIESSAR